MPWTEPWFVLDLIDLTKAFDTVNRDLLWQVLSKFGCPPNFLTVVQEFHNNMKAKVVVGGRMSDQFDVLVGLKQGCVLAPVIFNLFLVTVTLASRVGFPPDAGVPFIYRLDGSLFNMRRLTAETKRSLMTGSLSFSTPTMPLFLLTLPLLFRAASMYCQPFTTVLDLMSMLRRPKSCPLLYQSWLSCISFFCAWRSACWGTGVYVPGEYTEWWLQSEQWNWASY